MKEEGMLDVLMYLFENYMDGDGGDEPDQIMLENELEAAGFSHTEVSKALTWLEGLTASREEREFTHKLELSIRVFTTQEQKKFDVDARGLLLYLEQAGILTPIHRELVIDRAMALETDHIDIEQLKWVVLMVLLNQPGQETNFAWMEELVETEIRGYIH